MCSCHSILECCVTFSGVKLSIRSFVLFLRKEGQANWFQIPASSFSTYQEKSYLQSKKVKQ